MHFKTGNNDCRSAVPLALASPVLEPSPAASAVAAAAAAAAAAKKKHTTAPSDTGAMPVSPTQEPEYASPCLSRAGTPDSDDVASAASTSATGEFPISSLALDEPGDDAPLLQRAGPVSQALPSGGFPTSVYFIIGNEFCERCAFRTCKKK